MRNRKRHYVFLTLTIAVYLASYVVLSRRGYAEADRYHSEGFFYSPLERSGAWQFKHYGCVILFWPLNQLDQLIGTGRPPQLSVPLMDLSRGRSESFQIQGRLRFMPNQSVNLTHSWWRLKVLSC